MPFCLPTLRRNQQRPRKLHHFFISALTSTLLNTINASALAQPTPIDPSTPIAIQVQVATSSADDDARIQFGERHRSANSQQ